MMMMSKGELIAKLQSLGIPLAEGLQNDKDVNTLPRMVIFEIAWDDIGASGLSYETVVTYQISYYAKEPRSASLLELRNILVKCGLKPFISHENISKPSKLIHSFLAIDVIENLGSNSE